MPLKLKRVFIESEIRQIEWCRALKKKDGTAVSIALGNQILNWNKWPKTICVDDIKFSTREFLIANKVPPEKLNDMWEIDDNPQELLNVKAKQGDYSRKVVSVRKKTQSKKESKQQIESAIPETVMLSSEAKKHFKLFNDPFLNEIHSTNDLFLDADQNYIRMSMYQTAKHGGFLAVVGESGAGKTILRRDLLDRIHKDKEKIIVIQPLTIDKTKLSTSGICDAIIGDLAPNLKSCRSLEAKARQVESLLTDSSRAGNAHVLIIEEAHDLTIPILKYLKRFWELENGYKKLMSIIIIGQPELKDLLNENKNWKAREVIRRIEVAELQPIHANLEKYLEKKFAKQNRALDQIFTADAFDAIRARLTIVQSHGGHKAMSLMYPLMINITVRKAMNLALELGEQLVSSEVIKGV